MMKRFWVKSQSPSATLVGKIEKYLSNFTHQLNHVDFGSKVKVNLATLSVKLLA